jgi:hypothetical protein
MKPFYSPAPELDAPPSAVSYTQNHRNASPSAILTSHGVRDCRPNKRKKADSWKFQQSASKVCIAYFVFLFKYMIINLITLHFIAQCFLAQKVPSLLYKSSIAGGVSGHPSAPMTAKRSGPPENPATRFRCYPILMGNI